MKPFGVGVPWQLSSHLHNAALGKLKPVTWYNWLPNGEMPMAWGMNASDFEAARQRLGRFWLLYNEPESSVQANVKPFVAAKRIAQWQLQIGGDFAAPGVMIGTEGMSWLDEYLRFDGPIPPLWHIHLYAHSAQHLVDLWMWFRDWMCRHRVERPVIVSEVASWSEGLNDQRAVMDEMMRLLQSHALLHSAYWYSAHCGTTTGFEWWARSDLLDGNGNVTPLGQHYLALTQDAEGASVEPQVLLPVVSA